MAEIKDINKLVIKNSATIELERRKGFVNILLQGNPNLYRAWVERNNKIVIDISGESSEYSLNTNTPDYIEILKDQESGKYYINFVGPTGGTGQLISDDMTFEDVDGNTKITIKKSKFVSTDKISSGTNDYLYVNVDSSGNVVIGLNQDTINKIENGGSQALENVYLTLELNSSLNYGYIAHNSYEYTFGFKSGGYSGENLLPSEAIDMFKNGSLLSIKIVDTYLSYESEMLVRPSILNDVDDNEFAIGGSFIYDGGYSVLDKTNSINTNGSASYLKNTVFNFNIYSYENNTVPVTYTRETQWFITSNSQLVFTTTNLENNRDRLNFINEAFTASSLQSLFRCVTNLGKLYYLVRGSNNLLMPCELMLASDGLYIIIFDPSLSDGVSIKQIYYDNSNDYFYFNRAI